LVQLWVKTNAVAVGRLSTEGYIARVINYTSYWPSTTGVGIVYSYTSDWPKAYASPWTPPQINYAESWTATGGHVWANIKPFTECPYIEMTDSYETVTNTIGWFPDRNYMIALDAKIKSLIPYYADTNTVYDGTTNIVMLTVTGLWASLGIGDKTNQFTRTPCWTNSISTNWVVNYTSYWPSTNGTATNICYTSDYQQVVNYALSWTATGGHVWVSASNWASSVVIVTNAATYGEYPWQIYAQDLEERYKVLNALKMKIGSVSIDDFSSNAKFRNNNVFGAPISNWEVAKGYVDSGWESNRLSGAAGVNPLMESAGWMDSVANYKAYAMVNHRKAGLMGFSNTNLEKTVYLYVKGIAPSWYSTPEVTNPVFNSFGYPVSTNWSTWTSSNVGYSSTSLTNILVGPEGYPQPGWCAEPTQITHDRSEVEGWEIAEYKTIINWQFNYCTNKFW
jgi:hypothetical protein